MTAIGRPRAASGWALAALWALYLVMWAGGVGSYVARGGVRPGDAWAAPVFLALSGLIVLVAAGPRRGAAFLCAGAIGFLSEWIGLTGGWLFGDYTYSSALSPRLAGVPLVMASAWMVLAVYAHDLLCERGWPASARIAAGAVLLTTIDLVIDPLASGPLGYWHWSRGGAFYGVPARNFAGWFIVGLVTLALLHLAGQGSRGRPTTQAVGLSIVLFFTVLAASFGLVVPAIAGGVVCAVHLSLWRPGLGRSAAR